MGRRYGILEGVVMGKGIEIVMGFKWTVEENKSGWEEREELVKP